MSDSYRVTASEIKDYIERYERLESEKKELSDSQKEIMSEAKGRGYDTKILRRLISIRKRDSEELAEEESLLSLYRDAIGV